MKAIVHTKYGPPREVLELRDVEQPAPEDAEVLIRVSAAGVSKGDWLIARGEPYIARPSFGLRSPKHRVAGQEVAGVIEAVGAGAKSFQVGDEVFGWCTGAFAEYVAVAERQLVRKPTGVTFEQAAAVPISGVAALQSVRGRGEVQSGQQVLVIGAAGGVGSFAVQLARVVGADVTGVASTANVELVRSLGADRVIDYTRDDLANPGRLYDVIIDIAGNRSLSKLRKLLTPRGTVVIVGGTGGPTTMGLGRTVRAMLLSPLVRPRFRPLISQPSQPELDTLGELIDTGRLTPIVGATYALGETPNAVDELGAGSSRGKRVIRI